MDSKKVPLTCSKVAFVVENRCPPGINIINDYIQEAEGIHTNIHMNKVFNLGRIDGHDLL